MRIEWHKRLIPTTLNIHFANLQKLQTEWKFQKLLIRPPKEVKENNTVGNFKKKTNCLSYSIRKTRNLRLENPANVFRWEQQSPRLYLLFLFCLFIPFSIISFQPEHDIHYYSNPQSRFQMIAIFKIEFVKWLFQ